MITVSHISDIYQRLLTTPEYILWPAHINSVYDACHELRVGGEGKEVYYTSRVNQGHDWGRAQLIIRSINWTIIRGD